MRLTEAPQLPLVATSRITILPGQVYVPFIRKEARRNSIEGRPTPTLQLLLFVIQLSIPRQGIVEVVLG